MKKFKFSIDNNPFEVAVTELENGQIDVEVNGSNYIVTIDREGTKAANAPAPKAAPVAAPKAAAPAAAPKAAAPAAPAAAPAAGGAVKTVKSALPGSVTKLVMEVGQAVKKGVELAIEEINKAGGVNVNGTMKQLELVDFINDEADPNKAGTALTTLVSKNVDVVVGAVTSGATEGLISEAVKYGVKADNHKSFDF